MMTLGLTNEERRGFLIAAQQRKEVEIFGYELNFYRVHEDSIVIDTEDFAKPWEAWSAVLITTEAGTKLAKMLERARRTDKAARVQTEKRKRGDQISPHRY